MCVQAFGTQFGIECLYEGIIRHDADGVSFPASTQVANLRRSGPWGTGSTQVRAGRRTDMSCELKVIIWPPLRLARIPAGRDTGFDAER